MTGWPDGYRHLRLDATDSTNAEALRRAAAGDSGPLWISADRQTAARGRRGRAWAMPEGNLAASLLMTVPGGPGAAALRSFAAALALHDALTAVTGRPDRFALKWPNDVLMDGRKLAGILLESAGAADDVALVIGFGVNLAAAPDVATLEPGAVPPAALAEVAAVTPDDFLPHLAAAFAPWEARLRRDGFPPVRAAWMARAARIGQPVVARLPGRAVSGLFRTVDDTGALVIEAAGGTVTLPAAEVHFP